MAVLRRTRYKRDRLDPLLIPLVTEVLTRLPDNPAQFMLNRLNQHVTASEKIKNGKAGETEKEKKMADLMKLSIQQEEMLVCADSAVRDTRWSVSMRSDFDDFSLILVTLTLTAGQTNKFTLNPR